MQVEARPTFFAFGVWLLIATALLTLGCERQPTTVTGVVTLDHNRPNITPDMRGTISFQPQSGQGAIATGLLNATGEYEVSAGSTSEVAPGKYDVAISIVRLVSKSGAGEQGAKRITAAKYNSAASSGLTADVHSGPNVLNFDVASNADMSKSNADSSPRAAPSNDDLPEAPPGAKP
jgi:hypothetical protein